MQDRSSSAMRTTRAIFSFSANVLLNASLAVALQSIAFQNVFGQSPFMPLFDIAVRKLRITDPVRFQSWSPGLILYRDPLSLTHALHARVVLHLVDQ
jgi:hypothetical protein